MPLVETDFEVPLQEPDERLGLSASELNMNKFKCIPSENQHLRSPELIARNRWSILGSPEYYLVAARERQHLGPLKKYRRGSLDHHHLGSPEYRLGPLGKYLLGLLDQRNLGSPELSSLGSPGHLRLGSPIAHTLGSMLHHRLESPENHFLRSPEHRLSGSPQRYHLGLPEPHHLGAAEQQACHLGSLNHP